MPEENRVDKFLWCVRIFKTRSNATEACRKGRVVIQNLAAKPSRTVRAGDIIYVRKPPVTYTYRVATIPKSRISAKLSPEFIENLTPKEELEKLELQDNFFITRDKGTGRPTKKERRIIDKLRTK